LFIVIKYLKHQFIFYNSFFANNFYAK